jgi:excisionase family DNA binding protein
VDASQNWLSVGYFIALRLETRVPMDSADYEPPPARTEAFEPYLDSEEAARLLKIHPRTLQRMARRGEIAGVQIGRLWRFRASDLNAGMHGIIPHSYPCRLDLKRRRE